MQKHADIDKPEEVNEMAELEQELAAAQAQGGAAAAQPTALPLAEFRRLAERITTIPANFKPHPLVQKVIDARAAIIEQSGRLQ